MRLRAERVKDVEELRDWCRRLHYYGPHKCDGLRRFSIGLYQLHQAIDWAGTKSEYESYAAAAIHILASCEDLCIPTERVSPNTLLINLQFGPASYKGLLYNISKLQAQLVYATNNASIKRKSRYDSSLAAELGGRLVLDLLGMIPPEYREEAVYEAMDIMTGGL